MMKKNLFEQVVLVIILAVHQSSCRFGSNFHCKEGKQSTEYIEDVKIFARETSEFFNRRETPNVDLSELGLGFVQDGKLSTRTYHHILFLNISKNVFKNVDIDFLLQYPNLQSLDLSQNCLSKLEVAHRKIFYKLQSLNVSYNLITNIHPFTFANLSLNSLDLSHNQLIRFWAVDYEINQLYINNNKITQLEIDSNHFRELKLLDAHNNRIRIFKVNTNDFDNLLLSNNHLKLDENFSIRNVYGTLDLSKNHISEFDWKLISCVTNLNLSFNRLTRLQLECPMKKFQKIERLNLDGNFLCNLNVTGDLRCLPNLRYLSLLTNKLSEKEKASTKKNLTCLGIKSQIYDFEFFTKVKDDSGMIDIFIRN